MENNYTENKNKETMHVLDALKWRSAIKKFDPNKKVAQADLEILLEAANLAATSGGLQPFKVVVVGDGALKSQLAQHAFGQSQIKDASQLLVFAVETDISEKTVDNYVERSAEVRGQGKESLIGFSDSMKMYISTMDAEAKINWGKNQAYIALGTVLAAAAELRIDTCPMEGFDAAQFDDILDLSAKKLKPVLVLPIGYRSEEDVHSKEAKIRKKRADLVLELN